MKVRFIKGTKLEIIVEQLGTDKRPGLWVKSVTEENTIIKLASFANEEKANFFVTYLSKFLGLD